MVFSGSNDSIAQQATKRLSIAEWMKKEGEKNEFTQTYNRILAELTKDFEQALENKDYLTLFELEAVCQKHDKEHLKIDEQKSLKCFNTLKSLRDVFIEDKDPERVRQKYQLSIDTLNTQGARIIDDDFNRNVRSVSRIIGGCVGRRSTDEEKNLYGTRQQCLLAIAHEHQRDLDRAFGFDKVPKKLKDRDQGLSR